MADEIAQQVTDFIVENFLFGIVADAPQPSESFLALGYIDSTAMLELISFIEAEFGIGLADDELVPANLDSIDRINDFVKRKRTEAK